LAVCAFLGDMVRSVSARNADHSGCGESNENTNFRVVLVNTAETDEEVFAFLGIVAPNLPTLMDSDGVVTDHWQRAACRRLISSIRRDAYGIWR